MLFKLLFPQEKGRLCLFNLKYFIQLNFLALLLCLTYCPKIITLTKNNKQDIKILCCNLVPFLQPIVK